MSKRNVKILALALILACLASSLKASAEDIMPFEGLRLLYDLKLPLLTVSPPSSFKGTIEFTFMNVSSESADVRVVLEGELTTGTESSEVKLNDTITIPVGMNTPLYLKSDSDPSVEGEAEIIGLPLLLNGGQIFLGGIFKYEGETPIMTPAGRFTTYRLRNETTISNLNLETYLHYDKDSMVMVYAELKVRSGFYTYSYTMKLVETNLPREVQPSACLIATAAYGSPLDSNVQELRQFRDNIVLKTRLGSAFMQAFNAWYYSFSPYIAEAERRSEPLKAGSRTILYPLVGILRISKHVYEVMPSRFELNLIVTGLIASAMIGALYLSLILVVILHHYRRAGRRISVTALYMMSISTVGLLVEAIVEITPIPLLRLLVSVTVISTLIAGATLTAESIMIIEGKIRSLRR